MTAPLYNLTDSWTADNSDAIKMVATVNAHTGCKLLNLQTDSAPVFQVDQNGTYRTYRTYTSSTSYEGFEIEIDPDGNTGSFGIGSIKGSGGGTTRPVFGFGSSWTFYQDHTYANLAPINSNAITMNNGLGASVSLVNRIASAVSFIDSSTDPNPAGILYGSVHASKTSNYTVLVGESGIIFDNTGASAEVDFTLPTAAAGNKGLRYTFIVVAAQTLKVIAGASTKIAIGASNSGTAGNISNATAFGSVTLEAVSATQWVATSSTGTWTVT